MKKMYKKGGSLKAVPGDKKGLAKLPTAVRNKMGYMAKGGEKLLAKMMQMGGSMDMVDPFEMKMKYGKEYMKYGKEKKMMGGQSGRRVYSGPKKK